jgi:hypothetical protein
MDDLMRILKELQSELQDGVGGWSNQSHMREKIHESRKINMHFIEG